MFCDKNMNSDLGRGGFASVKLIKHRYHEESLFAMKIIKKASEEENNYIRNEAEIHRVLHH